MRKYVTRLHNRLHLQPATRGGTVTRRRKSVDYVGVTRSQGNIRLVNISGVLQRVQDLFASHPSWTAVLAKRRPAWPACKTEPFLLNNAIARGPCVRVEKDYGPARAKDHQEQWQVDRCPGLVCGLASCTVKRGNVSVCVLVCVSASQYVSVSSVSLPVQPRFQGRPTGTQA